jgi:hypothetical protein
MDALPLVPAVALSFGATYYLGKACLKLFISSLELPDRPRQKGPASSAVDLVAGVAAPADTIVS